MTLNEDTVRRIALDVAGEIFGASADISLNLSAGADWSGDFSYFLNFTLEQDRDRQRALNQRMRLRRDILNRLVNEGDETFPYVRILNRIATSTRD